MKSDAMWQALTSSGRFYSELFSQPNPAERSMRTQHDGYVSVAPEEGSELSVLTAILQPSEQLYGLLYRGYLD